MSGTRGVGGQRPTIHGEMDYKNVGLCGIANGEYMGGQGCVAIRETSSAPAGGQANTAIFYVSGGEMWVIDSGGNPTQLSPHLDGEWVHHEKRDGRDYIIWMERLVKAVEDLTGKEFSEWRSSE